MPFIKILIAFNEWKANWCFARNDSRDTYIFVRIYIEYRLNYANVGGNLIIISKLFEVGKSNSLLVFDRLLLFFFFFFFLRETTRDYVNRIVPGQTTRLVGPDVRNDLIMV